MRIQIKSPERNLTIPIPTGLLLNKTTVRLCLTLARSSVRSRGKALPEVRVQQGDDVFAKIPDETLVALCQELLRVKKMHGSWDLVEIQSSGGEEVLISL